MQTPPPRWLDWEACLNARELGGYPVQGGGQTRWKALVRSEKLFYLTPAGKQALTDYGVRTIIDLRFKNELDQEPDPFTWSPPNPDGYYPVYLNIPLDEDQNVIWPDPDGGAHALSDLYLRLLETNRTHVSRVIAAIAQAGPGAVLFHCAAGKDRTGIIAAVVLGALGVPEENIIGDYALNNIRLEERRLRFLADPALSEEKRAYWQAVSELTPRTMRLTLDELNERYGGIEGYLSTTPLAAEDLQMLRQRLIGERRKG